MKERVNKQTEGRRWVGATRIAIVQLYPDFVPSLVPFLNAVPSPPVLVEL